MSKTSDEYSVVQSLCRQKEYFENETSKRNIQWDFFRKTLTKVSPTCAEMLLDCEFGGSSFNCTQKFRTVLTDDGVCCIFNGVHREQMLKPGIRL